MKLENLKKVIDLGEKDALVGRGGRIYFDEKDRPFVFTAKENQKTYSRLTVNYVDFYDAVLRKVAGEEESFVSESSYSLRVKTDDSGEYNVLIFHDSATKQTGAMLLNDFKMLALLRLLQDYRQNVNLYDVVLTDTDGDKVVFKRMRKKLVLYFGPTPVNVPVPERVMLRMSLMKYLEEGELRPFLGNVLTASNRGEVDGPHVVLGVKNSFVKVDRETAFQLLKIL
ncbi:hypothetical protein [Desulfurobacterium sp.]